MLQAMEVFIKYKIWCLCLFFATSVTGSYTNFKIKRFELCNATQGVIKFVGNISVDGGRHYLTYDLNTPVPWDDNLGGSCSIQAKKFNNNFLELFMIHEKNFCKATHKYMGEFWYDIERTASLPPGVCPIPAGKYHVRHVQLDFAKISLQTFPFGRLRFVMNIMDNNNPTANMLCFIIEVDNVLN